MTTVPLPEPDRVISNYPLDGTRTFYYSEITMQAYGAACRAELQAENEALRVQLEQEHQARLNVAAMRQELAAENEAMRVSNDKLVRELDAAMVDAKRLGYLLRLNYADIAYMLDVKFGNYTPSDEIINGIKERIDAAIGEPHANK